MRVRLCYTAYDMECPGGNCAGHAHRGTACNTHRNRQSWTHYTGCYRRQDGRDAERVTERTGDGNRAIQRPTRARGSRHELHREILGTDRARGKRAKTTALMLHSRRATGKQGGPRVGCRIRRRHCRTGPLHPGGTLEMLMRLFTKRLRRPDTPAARTVTALATRHRGRPAPP